MPATFQKPPEKYINLPIFIKQINHSYSTAITLSAIYLTHSGMRLVRLASPTDPLAKNISFHLLKVQNFVLPCNYLAVFHTYSQKTKTAIYQCSLLSKYSLNLTHFITERLSWKQTVSRNLLLASSLCAHRVAGWGRSPFHRVSTKSPDPGRLERTVSAPRSQKRQCIAVREVMVPTTTTTENRQEEGENQGACSALRSWTKSP